jgi:type II secretory ATPase GspE/PulE/Tfp pilus assembly ATPase PilB-like protein
LSEQVTLKLPLGQILLKLNYVTDETMRQALGHQLNVPYLDLENVMIDRSLARVINPTFAKRHSLLPVATVGRTLTVAMDDPTATAVVQDLQRLTGFSVTVVTSSSRAIQRAFRRLYDDLPDVAEPARVEARRSAVRSQIIGTPSEADPEAVYQVDGLLHQLLRTALDRSASALHLEPAPGGVDVRIRIDGLLQRPALGPLQEALDQQGRELVARIRTLSQLDPVAPLRPQTGRAEVTLDRSGRPVAIDLGVSVVPGPRGDSVVMHLRDRSAAPRALDAIGLPAAVISGLVGLLARPAGVFLVTGPASSRAAETLHACLIQLARPDVQVVTAEDPIAYVNDTLTQSEVGAPGSTLGSHFRALLQHDADVIMVSDLGDRETAGLAFRAAGMGRLVLGGLAAGAGAVDVVPCLLDLGVPPSAISQSLAGVLHQRLVRTTGATGAAGDALHVRAELWIPDEQDASLILQHAPVADLRQSARRTTVA